MFVLYQTIIYAAACFPLKVSIFLFVRDKLGRCVKKSNLNLEWLF